MAWWRPGKQDAARAAEVEAARAALEGDAGAAPAWKLLARHPEHVADDAGLQGLWSALRERGAAPPDVVLPALYAAWEQRPLDLCALAELVTAGLETGGFEDEEEQRTSAAALARALERARDAAPGLPADVARELRRSLAHALRHAGPARDAEATALLQALAEEQPRRSSGWYNLGLLHKQRRRFAEGAAANLRARALAPDDEAVLWNLGICATGAGDGPTALAAWQALDLADVALGEDGLPRMQGLGMVQVRLSSEGSEAWRDAPPQYEHVWIQRLSPCHGRVLSPTLAELSADYGDLVLHDGAAIGYREDGKGRRTPRFPQLGVLRRSGDLRLRFAALQEEGGQVAALQEHLPEGCLVYPHTENVELLCRDCVRGRGAHRHAPERPRTHRQLFGKLVVPEGVRPGEVLGCLQEALRAHPHLRLAVPGLHAAVGDAEGAARAERAWAEVEGAED